MAACLLRRAAGLPGPCPQARRALGSHAASSRRPRRWCGARSCASEADDGGSDLNPETVSYLVDETRTREVYLVGTAHVSEASARDVRQTIRIAKPGTVMVELCPQRARRLKEGKATTPQDVVRQLLQQLTQPNQKPGFGAEMLLKLGFAGLYAMLRQFGLTPGQEFKVALDETDRLGLFICYGDRDIDQTMSKLRGALGHISFEKLANAPQPPAELASFFGGGFTNPMNIGASVENLKNRRHIALLRDYVASMAPEVMDVMVRERDLIMTDRLLDDCRVGRTVAVVGMAHLDGIEDEWRRRGGEVFLHGDNSLRRA